MTKKHKHTTSGLAKYGLDLVIFGSGNSVVLWFGAGHLLFSFLLLSSTKVFQSAFVPDLTSNYSRTSPSLERWWQYWCDTLKFISSLIMKQDKSEFSKHKIDRMFRLGFRMAYEEKPTKKDWVDIYNLWWCAATYGHIKAQFYLAVCYDIGNGTDKNVEEAYKWYLKAAKNGKMEAQYNIGFFYKIGEVVKQDFKKAVYWYQLAAKQGDTEAQRDLGYSYFYGEGIKQDPKKAIEYYRKAASKNDDKSFYNLGLCYKFGDGVKQSKRWEKHYFEKAVKFGNLKAKKELKRLNSK